MSTISRRSVIVTGLGAVTTLSGLPASARGNQANNWSAAVSDAASALSPAEQINVLRNSGTESFDELAVRLGDRFPNLQAGKNASEKLMMLAQGSPNCPYTRSNSHDKDCSHSRS